MIIVLSENVEWLLVKFFIFLAMKNSICYLLSPKNIIKGMS